MAIGREAWVRAWVVYTVRMPRVNIWLPDDLHRTAKDLGLPISELAQRAIAAEVGRLRKVELLDAYLAELDDVLGPPSKEELAAAERWAGRLPPTETFGGADRSRSA